jgi:hypothetical protein
VVESQRRLLAFQSRQHEVDANSNNTPGSYQTSKLELGSRY